MNSEFKMSVTISQENTERVPDSKGQPFYGMYKISIPGHRPFIEYTFNKAEIAEYEAVCEGEKTITIPVKIENHRVPWWFRPLLP